MRDRELDWSGSRLGSVARGFERGKERTSSIIRVEIFLTSNGAVGFPTRTLLLGTCSMFLFVCLFVTLLYTSLGLQRRAGPWEATIPQVQVSHTSQIQVLRTFSCGHPIVSRYQVQWQG